MKESTKRTVVEMDVIDPTTGELFKAQGINEVTERYYSIKRITSRVNAMDLLFKMEAICKSPKDINILNMLLDTHDNENKIRIDNITNLAKDIGISRSKLNSLLKKCVDTDLFRKLDRGIYFINPYIFIGRRVRSNKDRESCQAQWNRVPKPE